MMRPINQKLVASNVSRFMGYVLLSLPLTFAAKCGSLIETMDCIAKKYDLKRPCKVIDTKLNSTSPTQGQSNIPINTNRIYFYLENGNEEGFDPNQITATLQVGNRPIVYIPSSALEINVGLGATKLGSTAVGIKLDTSIYNQTDPNNPLNLAYGDIVRVNISGGGGVSFSVVLTAVENPAGLADIDNDQVLIEVPSVNQIVLRGVFNGYTLRTINLSAPLPATDYVFSQIEGNKLFMMRDIGNASRTAAGDAMSSGGHQVVEIDLSTGQVTFTTVPSQNTPIFNVMESIVNAHQGPTTTVTTANSPTDWRIYPVLRRNNIVNGNDAALDVRMYYNGGEYQEIIIPTAFSLFGGAVPALSVKLSNNTFVMITEPGRMLRMTFDYNSVAAWGAKVTITPNFSAIPLTLAGALPGEYVLGHDIIENKNIPGEVLVLYSDFAFNRFVQRYDAAGNFLGRIQVPNSVVKVISFMSQSIENAMGLVHNGTNQIQVMSGQNFGTGTLGVSAFTNNAAASQLAVVPQVPGFLNETAAQTLDIAEINNKFKAGVSVVNLTTQRIEKRTLNNTLSSTVDISGFINTLKTNLGTANDPNDAKVIEQGNNYILILKINDGVRERVAVLDLAASAATWISPAGSDCDMVYGVGKYNDGGTDRLLVLNHLTGSPNYVINNGLTSFSTALGGFSVNTMIMLDPDYTNGIPTQMRVAVAKTNGVQLLTFNKANLSVPASNTTLLNNLIAAVGADVNIGSVIALQATAGSDDDLATSTFYALVQVLKGGALKQMLLTVDTAGVVSAGWLEWNVSANDIRGFKRLSDGRFLIVDALGRAYMMDTNGATYRTFLSNVPRSNIYR